MIQQLLAEAGQRLLSDGLVSVDVGPTRGLEAAADWGDLDTAETYLGYERTERFASPGGAVPSDRHEPMPRLIG